MSNQKDETMREDVRALALVYPYEFGMNLLSGNCYVRDISDWQVGTEEKPFLYVSDTVYDRLLRTMRTESLTLIAGALDGHSVICGDVPPITGTLARLVLVAHRDQGHDHEHVCDDCQAELDAEAQRNKPEPS